MYKVYLPVYIVGHKLNVKFYVVSNLYPNVILGLDFLKSHNITFDFQSKKLYFDPRRQLVLEKGISIPAKSEIVVAKITGNSLPNEVIGLISTPSNFLSPRLLNDS